MNKRAVTRKQKKEILSRLYTWWLENEELRLGQLIMLGGKVDGKFIDPFYVEDYDLVPESNEKKNGP